MQHRGRMLMLERTTRALRAVNNALAARSKRLRVLESQMVRGVLFELTFEPGKPVPHRFSVRRSGVELRHANAFSHVASLEDAWHVAKDTYDSALGNEQPGVTRGTMVMPAVRLVEARPA